MDLRATVVKFVDQEDKRVFERTVRTLRACRKALSSLDQADWTENAEDEALAQQMRRAAERVILREKRYALTHMKSTLEYALAD
jgi:hypothetical protein